MVDKLDPDEKKAILFLYQELGQQLKKLQPKTKLLLERAFLLGFNHGIIITAEALEDEDEDPKA